MIYKNASGKRATVPFHSARTLHPKVLKSILRDDEAVRAAKGGGPWRRVARATKWLVIGAAAGAIAAKAHR